MDQELNSTRPHIRDVEEQGRDAHAYAYGKTDLRRWVMNFGLYTLWAGLPLLVAGFGFVLSGLIIVNVIVKLLESTPFIVKLFESTPF